MIETMTELPAPRPDDDRVDRAAELSREARQASLHALQVLEYALSAPAPRRERTWLHRVTVALDALATALDKQMHAEDESLSLLSEIALCEPKYTTQIHRLRQEQADLAIAVASLREQIEPNPELHIDTADVRDRLAAVARRYRQHRARESDLIYEAVGIELDVGPELS
jgi:hypothetical protein